MKFKVFIALLQVILFVESLQAGDVIPLKKFRKIELIAAEGDLEKAEKQLEKLLLKYPHDGAGWDLLVNLRYKAWEDSKKSDLFFQKITIQVKDSTGKTKEGTNDSLVNTLANLFKSVKISDGPLAKLLYTCRKATLLSGNAEMAALVFRAKVLDSPVDTNVADTAAAVFVMAEEYFFQENYEKAARYYRDALMLDSNYYQAALYLGDAYYFMGDYDRAIDAFIKAKHRGPHLIEPRKFLYDAYNKTGADDRALQEAILSMMVLPEHSMMERIKLSAEKLKLNWSVGWTPRGVFPNTFRMPQQYKSFRMDYSDPFEPVAKGPWIFYEAAKTKLDPYCDERGVVIAKNDFTSSQYLEVYSWEEMLKNSNDPALDQARQMQKAGFLDCYVFISCFHFDLLEQYKEFVSRNEQKVKEYFRVYMR